MEYVVAVVCGYLFGSVPTAFLLVRLKTGIDIRKAGSGNVGAFNTYDVTQSLSNGVIVGVVDAIKGFVVTAGAGWLLHVAFPVQAVAFFASILGHNYPVWLKFKGGRGLATAAGGLIAIGFAYTIVWCILWVVLYRIRKDIHKANLAAILATPLILLAVPSVWLGVVMTGNVTGQSYQLLAFILSVLLLLSHGDVVRQMMYKRRLGHE